MLNALIFCAVAVVQPDTAPVVLAGSPAPVPTPAPVPMTPLALAMSKPRAFAADSMVVDKSERRLELYYAGKLVKTYAIALGRNPVGRKTRRGDRRTPEGLYYIEGRNPRSKYHLSLRISYPNNVDRELAAQRGVNAGGDIMIHGLPKAFSSVGALHRQQDWTEGCIAVTNDEIEEIWRSVDDGARILIRP